MKTVLRRTVAALKLLTNWYLTPTGGLVMIATIAAIVVATAKESPVPMFVAAIFLLLIVFPWKITRSQASLNLLKEQLTDRTAAAEGTPATSQIGCAISFRMNAATTSTRSKPPARNGLTSCPLSAS